MSSLTLLCYRALLASSREYTDPVISVIVVRITYHTSCIFTLYPDFVLDVSSGSETERGTRWSTVVKRTLRGLNNKNRAKRLKNKQ